MKEKPCAGEGEEEEEDLEPKRVCASVLSVRSCFINLHGLCLLCQVSREMFACY